MVENMSSSEEYKEFELKHNRHLNMLQDNDRNKRREALNEFKKVMEREKNDSIVEFFYRERLVKKLILTLEDQVEKNRELSIEILTKAIERTGLKDEAQILLPAIIARMNNNPFPENSEEIRIELVELLQVCLQCDKFQLIHKMSELCSMISKVALDANPEMKSKIAKFASSLSKDLKDKIGIYMKTTVLNLIQNLGHQHSKVRKQTLLGLKDVIVSKGAEPFVEDALLQLKFIMNDRSQDVRTTFYEVIAFWLTEMEITCLRQVEKHFVLFLLNGVADESEAISSKCKEILENHGNNMKEALIKLGEEKSDAEMETEQIQ